MSISCKYGFILNTTETLETGEESLATDTVTHSAFDETGSLNAGTIPPGTKISAFLMALTAGAYTINLASMSGVGGVTQDFTGLKVQAIRIKNLGANSMAFAPGASNGIDIGCGTITVPPNNGIVQIYCPEAGQDVAAGDRTIDVTGTGAQTAEVTIIAG